MDKLHTNNEMLPWHEKRPRLYTTRLTDSRDATWITWTDSVTHGEEVMIVHATYGASQAESEESFVRRWNDAVKNYNNTANSRGQEQANGRENIRQFHAGDECLG